MHTPALEAIVTGFNAHQLAGDTLAGWKGATDLKGGAWPGGTCTELATEVRGIQVAERERG